MLKVRITNGRRLRVLVVDDSVVIRRLLTNALSEDPQIEVVGTAANGILALQKISQTNPDVVTLDVEMPEMDGIEALRQIRKQYPSLVVIMFSTLTRRGGEATMEALALGANDYATKPANVGALDRAIALLREELIPKLKQFFDFGLPHPALPKEVIEHSLSQKTRLAEPLVKVSGPKRVLLIGSSTGGPAALSDVIPLLPADFPVPILVVQHMPPMFTKLLAERLQQKSKIKVDEAQEGMQVEAGHAYIAPGDYHLGFRRDSLKVYCTLNQGPPENSCRPAVDVMFRAAQATFHGPAIAVVLTGMGQDGLRGVEALRPTGSYVIAQDEESSVVWGMPGAVARAGLANAVLPLRCIVPEIMKHLSF